MNPIYLFFFFCRRIDIAATGVWPRRTFLIDGFFVKKKIENRNRTCSSCVASRSQREDIERERDRENLPRKSHRCVMMREIFEKKKEKKTTLESQPTPLYLSLHSFFFIYLLTERKSVYSVINRSKEFRDWSESHFTCVCVCGHKCLLVAERGMTTFQTTANLLIDNSHTQTDKHSISDSWVG